MTVGKFKGQIDIHYGFLSVRLDSEFSQLYQEIEKQTRTLGDMMRQTSSVLNIVPEVDVLKTEVHNLVLDLPRGMQH